MPASAACCRSSARRAGETSVIARRQGERRDLQPVVAGSCDEAAHPIEGPALELLVANRESHWPDILPASRPPCRARARAKPNEIVAMSRSRSPA